MIEQEIDFEMLLEVTHTFTKNNFSIPSRSQKWRKKMSICMNITAAAAMKLKMLKVQK